MNDIDSSQLNMYNQEIKYCQWRKIFSCTDSEDSLRCVNMYNVGRGDDNDEYSSSHFLSDDDKCDVSTNILTGKCLNQQENNKVKLIFIYHYFNSKS